MVSQTNEAALEAHIEKHLTGSSRESGEHGIVAEPAPKGLGVQVSAGYEIAHPANYDPEFAIDKEAFWRFLETTQAEELEKLKDRHDWQRLILERLDRKIKKDGILSVLKKGISIDDAHLNLLYRQPYSDLNPEVIEKFNSNIFSIARQIHYSSTDTYKSVDC